MSVNWIFPMDPAWPVGTGSADFTLDIRAHSKRDLVPFTSTLAPLIPVGNDVELLSVTDRSRLKVTKGRRYVRGTNVFGAPAAPYTGIGGTGYGGAPPVDPARVGTTPKPVIALATPWRGSITTVALGGRGNELIAVLANAEDGLTGVMGYLEGATIFNNDPVLFTYDDPMRPAGYQKFYGEMYFFEINPALYTGFSTDLLRSVRAYFEAIPAGGVMQNKVIGGSANSWEQFIYYPRSIPYDFGVIVTNIVTPVEFGAANTPWSPDLTAPEPWRTNLTPVAEFNNLSDAVAYTGNFVRAGLQRNVTMICPQVLVYPSANGYHQFTTASTSTFGPSGSGYCYVDSADDTVDVTFGRSTWDRTLTDWRPGFNGVWIRGPGFKCDITHWTNFAISSSLPRHVFEGVEYVCDFDYHQLLDDAGHSRGYRNTSPAAHFMLDCHGLTVGTAAQTQYVFRNVVHVGVNADLNNGTWCMTGPSVVYGMSSVQFRDVTPAMGITPPVGAINPTYQRTAGNGDNAATYLFFDNAIQVGPTIQCSQKRISEIVTECNASIPGWVFDSNVVANDRVTDKCAAYIQWNNTQIATGAWITGAGGAPAMAAGVRYQTYAFIDAHIDGLQSTANGFNNWPAEILIFGAEPGLFSAQQLYLIRSNNHFDFTWVIAASSNSQTAGPSPQFDQWPSNGDAYTHQNIRFLGLIDTGGNISMGNTAMVAYGSYSRMNGVIALNFDWGNAAIANTAFPGFNSCHIIAPADPILTAFNAPTNISGGSTRALVFPHEDIQNLQPDIAIVGAWGGAAFGVMPRYDLQGVERTNASVKGPLVDGAADGAIWTRDQFLTETAAVNPCGVTGSLGSATWRWHTGAGNTGPQITRTFAFNGVANAP